MVCEDSVLVFDLVCISLCPFQLYNYLEDEEVAGCFVFYCPLDVSLL